MTEFLKNNINIRDLFWFLIILIPGIVAWTNVESEQRQQRIELTEMKNEIKEEKYISRSDRKELNDKIDKVLFEITNVKIELQRKKNIDNN